MIDPEASREPELPAFSVIIPTYQRRNSLARVLKGLEAQRYPLHRLEVIVISDGSTDGSVEMVRHGRYPFAVQVLEQPNQGPGAARNSGLRRARGPFVLFLDDDVVPSPALLAEHARAHGSARDLAVIGALLPPVQHRSAWVAYEASSLDKQYRAMEAGVWQAGPRQFYTGNASILLEHLQRAGGFDTSFRRAEDVELAFRLERLGVRFRFHRAADGEHQAERPFSAWLAMAYAYGRADAVMGLQRDRRDLLDSVAAEFHQRHPRIRQAIDLGLRHRRLTARLFPVGQLVAQAAVATRLNRLSYAVCSAMFNVNYWCGLGDQLGGVAAVRALLAQAAANRANGRLAGSSASAMD